MDKNQIGTIRDARGLSKRALAQKIEAHPSTIGKLESGEMPLNVIYMRKIAKALDVPAAKLLPKDMLGEDPESFVQEDGPAERYVPKTPAKPGEIGHNRPDILQIMLEGNPKREAWVMRRSTMEGRGIFKGDQLIVDSGRTPKYGDICCLHVVEGDSARTEFLVYMPPFFIAAPATGKIVHPVLFDPDKTTVMGIVTDVLRQNIDHMDN